MGESNGEGKPKAGTPKKEKRLTEYVVFMVTGHQRLEVVDLRKQEVDPKFPQGVATIPARTSAEAREIAFEHLTKAQPEGERDDYKVPLVALAGGGWSFEEMAWKIKREIAR